MKIRELGGTPAVEAATLKWPEANRGVECFTKITCGGLKKPNLELDR